MRIITGKYKGRRFDVPRTFKARPTTDFAKENLFNVLNGYIDLDGTMALDLFAGTGSISLELLSRGCAQVISVEKDRDHHAFISQC
ncbi:MAG: RsmD family RNA methyltransferase, partial [Prevotella sp.]|nr:RsmD family RNA methyltransferase [Prevotellaceae bacterium]MDY5249560.1 RsmD family RNA methyltransferase [Prevotella sp.]